MQLKIAEQASINELSRSMAPSKGVIVARNPLISTLMASLLSQNFNFESVTARHSDLLQLLKTTRFGIVIISAELSSNPESGLDLASAVHEAHPQVPIVVLVDQPESGLVVRAFRSGARGVFDMQDPPAEFVNCVSRVTQGAIWAGKKATDHLLETLRRLPSPDAMTVDRTLGLSTRELQVVQCAAKGRTNQEIAEELRLSKHTVKNYLFKAFEKLGVSSRVELLFSLSTRGHLHSQLMTKRESDIPDEETSSSWLTECKAEA